MLPHQLKNVTHHVFKNIICGKILLDAFNLISYVWHKIQLKLIMKKRNLTFTREKNKKGEKFANLNLMSIPKNMIK
jgi:hypothetical protein